VRGIPSVLVVWDPFILASY